MYMICFDIWFLLNMRLMPKGAKNNDNAPLSVARERVRDSWKVLKQSLYYFSLNSKSKSTTPNGSDKNLSCGGGEHSQQLDIPFKDEKDISVETLVNQNVKSFLNDSDDDYDGISELLEKYRYEVDAFNRLKTKLNGGDVASEFSEISSISELSLSSDSDEDAQTVISEFNSADIEKLQNRLSFNEFYTDHSPALTPDTIYAGHSPTLTPDTIRTVSSRNQSLSTSTSTISAKVSPSHRTFKPVEKQGQLLPDQPPPERTRAVLKPLPTLMKPAFIPDISNFDNGDLNNVVMAQASSVVNSKRTSSKGSKESSRKSSRSSQGETRATVNQLTAKSEINDIAEDTIEEIEVNEIHSSNEAVLEKVGLDDIIKESVEEVDIDNVFRPTSKNTVEKLTFNDAMKSAKNDNTVQLNKAQKNCLPLKQLFNKKNNVKKNTEVKTDDLLFFSYTQHMKNISDTVKSKHANEEENSLKTEPKGTPAEDIVTRDCPKSETGSTPSLDDNGNYLQRETRCTSSLGSVHQSKTSMGNRLHHTVPRSNSQSLDEPAQKEGLRTRVHSTPVIADDKPKPRIPPINISQSTMQKYPHIFANYLNFQHDPFHSLPNLTVEKRNSSTEALSSFDSGDFLNKPTKNGDLAQSSNVVQEVSATTTNCKVAEKHDNSTNSNETSSVNSISMIDENYFIVYPEMSEEKIICGNPPCSKEQTSTEFERAKFTSCPSCFICYCSRTCRHCHWPEHKQSCLVGFVNFYVHTFFRRCEKDTNFNSYLRNLAHEAYQMCGKGCLMIPFESPSDIEYDATSSNSNLSTQPTYKDFKTILNENKSHRHLHMLCQNIRDYDPEQEFVLNIFVWIGRSKIDGNTCTAVVRSARISMITSQNPDYGDSILSYGIRTFSLPISFQLEAETDVETRRYYCKEIAFGLKRYGVHLKSEYPEAYEKLYRYIDKEVLFTPIILYGKRNERNYKCILYSGKMKKSQEYYGEGAFV